MNVTTPTGCKPITFYLEEYIATIVELYNIVIESWNTLREESSQTNIILHYKLLASILSAVCSVIQLSYE